MDPALAAILEQQRLAHIQQMEMMQQLAATVNSTQQGLLASQQNIATVVQQMQAGGGGSRSSASSSGLREQIRSVVDPKILERLRDFSGRDEDFPEWSTKLQGLASLFGLDEVMRIAINEPDESVVRGAQDIDDEVRAKSRALYFMLLQACQGKAFTIVRASRTTTGSWRGGSSPASTSRRWRRGTT